MKRKLNSTLLALLLLSIIACKKQVNELNITDPEFNLEKHYNPYSVANMQKTLGILLVGDVQLMKGNKPSYIKGKILLSNGREGIGPLKNMSIDESIQIAKETIAATHNYIKFMPKDNGDYDKLKADSNLTIYPFPLDNPKTPYSGNYRNPSVPALLSGKKKIVGKKV